MKFIVVTGISGAGKSRAVAALEDMGFYCIDNMPPAMIPKFAEMCFQSGGKLERVAFVADSRGLAMFGSFFEGLDGLAAAGYPYQMLFLECSNEVLIKRYKETRRKHHLSDQYGGSVSQAIEHERQLLAPLKSKADFVIDTSSLTPAQLRDRLFELFSDREHATLSVNVISFGYKYGVPIDADLMFDVRFMTNPFYVEGLRALSGLDKPVHDYVMENELTKQFMEKLFDLIDFLIPLYVEEGKSHLVIAIGCTGGRHRSVAIADELGKHITEKVCPCTVSHRDISK